jgi:hypothetical protein
VRQIKAVLISGNNRLASTLCVAMLSIAAFIACGSDEVSGPQQVSALSAVVVNAAGGSHSAPMRTLSRGNDRVPELQDVNTCVISERRSFGRIDRDYTTSVTRISSPTRPGNKGPGADASDIGVVADGAARFSIIEWNSATNRATRQLNCVLSGNEGALAAAISQFSTGSVAAAYSVVQRMRESAKNGGSTSGSHTTAAPVSGSVAGTFDTDEPSGYQGARPGSPGITDMPDYRASHAGWQVVSDESMSPSEYEDAEEIDREVHRTDFRGPAVAAPSTPTPFEPSAVGLSEWCGWWEGWEHILYCEEGEICYFDDMEEVWHCNNGDGCYMYINQFNVLSRTCPEINGGCAPGYEWHDFFEMCFWVWDGIVGGGDGGGGGEEPIIDGGCDMPRFEFGDYVTCIVSTDGASLDGVQWWYKYSLVNDSVNIVYDPVNGPRSTIAWIPDGPGVYTAQYYWQDHLLGEANFEAQTVLCDNAAKAGVKDTIRSEYRLLAPDLHWSPSCSEIVNDGGTTNFSWDNLNDNFSQGSGHPRWAAVWPSLGSKLEALLTAYNRGGIRVSSGYRCPHGNATIPTASKTSNHMKGAAADLYSSQYTGTNWTETEFNLMRDAGNTLSPAESFLWARYPDHHYHISWNR